MYKSIDLSTMRKRSRQQVSEKTQSTSFTAIFYNAKGVQTGQNHISGKFIPISGGDDSTWDVVNVDFKKRRANGEIFNNPFVRVSSQWSGPFPAISGRLVYTDNGSAQHSGVIPGKLYYEPKLETPTRLIDAAVTKAFANVTSAEEEALLWAAELRESIAMFRAIGQRLLSLLKATKAERKAWAKGKLSVSEAQSLTLALQYGLLPLEDQITSWRNGLLKLRPSGRTTFRGYGKGNLEEDLSEKRELITGYRSMFDIKGTERLEYNIRAGALYDVISDVPGIMPYIDARSIVTTAYAIMRLSFVYDWFINIGETLASWAPTANVRYLSSWVTVEEMTVVNMTANLIPANLIWPKDIKSDSRTASTSFYLERYRKVRYPVSISDKPVLPDININLNVDKIFSLILLLAKAK